MLAYVCAEQPAESGADDRATAAGVGSRRGGHGAASHSRTHGAETYFTGTAG